MHLELIDLLHHIDPPPYAERPGNRVLDYLLEDILDEFTTHFIEHDGKVLPAVPQTEEPRTTNNPHSQDHPGDQATATLHIQGRTIDGSNSYHLCFILDHHWHSSGCAYIPNTSWYYSHLLKPDAGHRLAEILSPRQPALSLHKTHTVKAYRQTGEVEAIQ
jgi:hypothetical protein